jgi:hypothetical protein
MAIIADGGWGRGVDSRGVGFLCVSLYHEQYQTVYSDKVSLCVIVSQTA